jgi:hypothetical protein
VFYVNYIFHTIAYYLSWLLCLYLAAHGAGTIGACIVVAITALQICWQFYFRLPSHGLLRFVLYLTLLGSSIDTLLLWSGLIKFASNPFTIYFTAPWMSALWFSFAVTIFVTMHRFFKFKLMMSLLALPGFMISYALGAKFGAASFPNGYMTCILIGVIWALLLPLYLFHYDLNRIT